jgi:hypothetical protein
MSNPTAKDRVIAALTARPGQSAKELGETPVTMNRLMNAGVVEKVTVRGTGDRGRPSNIYVLVGQDYDTSADDRAALEAARVRVEATRSYERLWSRTMHAFNEFGYGSPEHLEAKAAIKAAFPTPPAIPSSNDYTLVNGATFTEADMLDGEDAEGVEDLVAA